MQVTIDGVVTPLLLNSLSVDNSVGQRSSASLSVLDTNGTNHYNEGQRVDVTDASGTLIYSGVIDADDEMTLDSGLTPATLIHKLTCKDWHYLADKRLVAKSYVSGQTCGAIMRDLLATILSAEGVSSVANLLSVNQSNVETDTTGFVSNGNGTPTITRDVTQQWQGAASLKLVTSATAFCGVKTTAISAKAATTYTASIYVMATAGTALQMSFSDATNSVSQFAAWTADGTWTRHTLTLTTGANAVTDLHVTLSNTASAAISTAYMDGLQIEIGPAARVWAVGQSTYIADGVTLPDVVFNYATVAACFDAITQKAGAYWWAIDQYKQLWFQPYAAIPAPWSLTTSGNVVTDARYGSVVVKRAKPLYRNRQYIRGATGLTASQTETRRGDGNTKAFTFGYPFAQVPTVTVNGTAKTLGIKGVDTGKDWYWNGGDPTLTQDSAGTTLISTDTLQVVYVGQFPVTIVSEDTSQVVAQRTLEGGASTGYVEDITEDTSLTTQTAAFQEASALLARYAQKATTLRFQTSRPGLAPGQLLSVTIPAHDLNNAQMLIESVRIHDEDGQIIWYEVTALLGPVNTTWVQFFANLVQQTQTSSNALSVGQNSTLVVAQSFTENWTWTESVVPTAYACPIFPATFPLTLC